MFPCWLTQAKDKEDADLTPLVLSARIFQMPVQTVALHLNQCSDWSFENICGPINQSQRSKIAQKQEVITMTWHFQMCLFRLELEGSDAVAEVVNWTCDPELALGQRFNYHFR